MEANELKFELNIQPDEWAEAPENQKEVFGVFNIRRHLEVDAPPEALSSDPNVLRENGYTLYLVRGYVHSGVALALAEDASGYPFDCPFDSGWAGFIAVDPKAVPDTHAAAKCLIDEWNMYLSGDVWQYDIYQVEVCNLGHGHKTKIESCGNFYGRKHAEEEGQAALRHVRENYQQQMRCVV